MEYSKTNVEDVYIVDCGENGYKLTKSFLHSNSKDQVDEKIKAIEERGMIIVNTLTTSGTVGPNLVCIDADHIAKQNSRHSRLLKNETVIGNHVTVTRYINNQYSLSEMISKENKEDYVGKDYVGINYVSNPKFIEHGNVEHNIISGNINRVPAGDITIWDPEKNKNIIGMMFSNSAPTIILKSDNGKVGMGVLVRKNITKHFFENLKQVMGGNITIEVVSSTMGKYPAVKEDGTELLPDASNKERVYTLPGYIADVANQVGINCDYEKCIDVDKDNRTFSPGEEGKEGLKNTPFIFDPSKNLKPKKADDHQKDKIDDEPER